ncbi:MAG TPA: response regulator transcription factor [Anaerolineae bacterium]
MAIQILLVDDHKIVRQGTRQLLEQFDDLTVIAEASNGEDALRLCAELQPQVVVMDIHMPGMNGLDATRAIHMRHPNIHVIILSGYDDDRYVFPSLDAGAIGYLLKTASGEDLANAIRAVSRGDVVLDRHISERVRNRLSQPRRAYGQSDTPTEREIEVLRAVAQGKSNKEIGELLSITTNTVQVHLRNVFGKLGVNDRTEAVAYAIRMHWISLD